MPTPVKYHSEEERKAAAREASRKHGLTEKGIATRLRYRATEKAKAAARAWAKTEAGRAKSERQRATEGHREAKARYRASDKGREWERAYLLSSPLERRQARQAVGNAVKAGRLVKPSNCSGCSSPRPQAHHAKGYAREHWLTVEWLCPKCHAQAHAATATLSEAA